MKTAKKKSAPRKKAAARKKAPAKATQGRKAFVRSLRDLDQRVREIASTLAGLWRNQQSIDIAVKGLAESERSLDHQVAVLTRVTITNLNKLRALAGEDFIGAAELEAVFADWNEFHKRPDANQHMAHWVTGKPLSDLPPPPEPEPEAKEEDDDSAGPETGTDEAASEAPHTIFGGNYAESDHGNETAGQSGPEDETRREDDEVPRVRTPDAPDDQGEAVGSDVSEMST